MAGTTKRTVQLYGSIAASADAVSNITVPAAGTLVGMQIVIRASTGGTSGDVVDVEVSTNSARQTTTSDATGILGIASCMASLATQGGAELSTNCYIPVNARCKAGDKIYLHATESGANTWLVRVVLYFA